MSEFNSSYLIHAGALLYIIAFVVRDEVILRLLVVTGTALYILYYYFFPSVPLWDAIISSVIMVAANFYVLGQLVLERTTLRLSPDEKLLFGYFDTLSPGQFRDLFKLADWHEVPAGDTHSLTQEGEALDTLYFLFEGSADLEKLGQHFSLPKGNFIGEIAFLLGRSASATCRAGQGARYVAWDSKALKVLLEKRPALGNALGALLTGDLAEKLAASVKAQPGKQLRQADFAV